MLKKYFVSALVLFFTAGLSSAEAQFEGQIVFDSYDVESDGSRKQSDQFILYVTSDRILLDGSNEYNVIGSIKTEGVLVRLDFEDFVFLNGDETALKISRQDITSMMGMFSNGNSGNRADRDHKVNYRKTGETRVIKGYTSEKFVFSDEDNPDAHAVVWMTDDLDINWGMLSEKWGNSELDVLADDLSFNLIFQEGYFPLALEAYESGKLREITEAVQVSESSIARAMVQVPTGIKVLSFQDYLFSKMSQD